MTPRVLIVEDEPAIAESVAYALERDGFTPTIVGGVEAAERQLLGNGAHGAAGQVSAGPGSAGQSFTMIVLDLMLPDGSGFDLIARLRHAGNHTPVIVLSSRDDEADRVSSLEAGADDYVTKPFSPREVVARVRAVLRRARASDSSTSEPLSVRIDSARRRATVRGEPLELTRVEFDLLEHLLSGAGRVLSRSQLIDRVWGDGFALSDRTVDSHVKSLRKKIADAGGDPNWIETVRGVGYRMTEGST